MSCFRAFNSRLLNNFNENAETLNDAGNSLAEITASVKEQALAMQEGLRSLEKVNGSLHDTKAILDVVQTSHAFLDTLLDQKQD